MKYRLDSWLLGSAVLGGGILLSKRKLCSEHEHHARR
jgi:hypothetical protein